MPSWNDMPWNNGPWNGNGFTGFGPLDAMMDGDFEIKMSMSGNGSANTQHNYQSRYAVQPTMAAPAVIPTPPPAQLDGDTDNYGVTNNRDLCPTTTANTKVDFTGCADSATIALRGVNFKTDFR